jgi:hypothetical protein
MKCYQKRVIKEQTIVSPDSKAGGLGVAEDTEVLFPVVRRSMGSFFVKAILT